MMEIVKNCFGVTSPVLAQPKIHSLRWWNLETEDVRGVSLSDLKASVLDPAYIALTVDARVTYTFQRISVAFFESNLRRLYPDAPRFTSSEELMTFFKDRLPKLV
jgi:hypothetical protein